MGKGWKIFMSGGGAEVGRQGGVAGAVSGDDKGYWNKLEIYITEHAGTQFSHGICPDCMKKNFPEFADEILK